MNEKVLQCSCWFSNASIPAVLLLKQGSRVLWCVCVCLCVCPRVYFRNVSTHTPVQWPFFRDYPGWAGTRKVKQIWILLKKKTVSGSGISWAICKSAPHSRLITTPAPHHSGVCACHSYNDADAPVRSWERTVASESCWAPAARRRCSDCHWATSAERRSWSSVHRCLQCSHQVSTHRSPEQLHTQWTELTHVGPG